MKKQMFSIVNGLDQDVSVIIARSEENAIEEYISSDYYKVNQFKATPSDLEVKKLGTRFSFTYTNIPNLFFTE